MGEMASTLAHELNQPLAAIASYTTGCINRLQDEAPLDRAELLDVTSASPARPSVPARSSVGA